MEKENGAGGAASEQLTQELSVWQQPLAKRHARKSTPGSGQAYACPHPT